MVDRKMNPDEQIAFNYLLSVGHDDIIYEPDGNIPPDFSLGSQIGVEVRRLNQHHFHGIHTKGLEEGQFRLNTAIKGILREFDEDALVDAYWLVLNYRRPLGKLKKIKSRMKEELVSFLQSQPPTPHEVTITPRLSMKVLQAGYKDLQRFSIGIESDDDSGGWVIPMYKANIEHCIMEKTGKINPYQTRYARWWLILIDRLLGLSAHEVSEHTKNISKLDSFERVIIIDPITSNELFEL